MIQVFDHLMAEYVISARLGNRRHPTEVTSDRLAAHREKWCEHFTKEELAALSVVRGALERIAGGGLLLRDVNLNEEGCSE